MFFSRMVKGSQVATADANSKLYKQAVQGILSPCRLTELWCSSRRYGATRSGKTLSNGAELDNKNLAHPKLHDGKLQFISEEQIARALLSSIKRYHSSLQNQKPVDSRFVTLRLTILNL
jgi:hypothetical protein